jgi:Na+/proline symporter
MSWMWMNLSLAIVFFGAFAGIPMYLVLRNPSFSSLPADTPVPAPARQHTGAAAERVVLPTSALADAAA